MFKRAGSFNCYQNNKLLIARMNATDAVVFGSMRVYNASNKLPPRLMKPIHTMNIKEIVKLQAKVYHKRNK